MILLLTPLREPGLWLHKAGKNFCDFVVQTLKSKSNIAKINLYVYIKSVFRSAGNNQNLI